MAFIEIIVNSGYAWNISKTAIAQSMAFFSCRLGGESRIMGHIPIAS